MRLLDFLWAKCACHDQVQIFAQRISEYPIFTHLERTCDGSAVKISDFLTRTQFHRLGLYHELFRRLGIEDQMAVSLAVRPTRLIVAAAYHWQVGDLKLTTRLNFINLFDQRYFESSNITDPLTQIPRLGIIPGPPLTVLGSIQVTY